MISIIINYFYYKYIFTYATLTMAILIIYINIQLEQEKKMKELELKVNENKMSLMLSQIQPHFLYNVLNAIDGLCYENEKAHMALISFANYFRFNMDSLGQKKLIPFEKELNHTKQYLWLEKLRFEERLNIIYEINVIDFLIPVLTLQPIVENAVCHGITKKRSGGTITIKTEEIMDYYIITVIDDGVGINHDKPLSKNKSHMGIVNVRDRLLVACNGKIIIESTIDKGTNVRIEIPKLK